MTSGVYRERTLERWARPRSSHSSWLSLSGISLTSLMLPPCTSIRVGRVAVSGYWRRLSVGRGPPGATDTRVIHGRAVFNGALMVVPATAAPPPSTPSPLAGGGRGGGVPSARSGPGGV